MRAGRSLQTRILAINLASVGSALVVAALILTVLEFFSLRARLLEDARVQARIVADNSAAALLFGDRKTAAEVLHALHAAPQVEAAVLFGSDDRPFTGYQRAGAEAPQRPIDLPDGHRYTRAHLELAQPVDVGGVRHGLLFMRMSLASLYRQLAWYGGGILLAVLSALAAAYLVLHRMQRTVLRAEADLVRLAHYDPLTGLANRLAFNQALRQAAEDARRRGEPFALLFMDVDHFKYVNDTLGHPAGDQLLIQTADRLKTGIRTSDQVFRLGGDEFTIIATHSTGSVGVPHLAQRLCNTLSRPFSVAGQEVHVGASIGISVFPDDSQDTEILVRMADTAMYHAKEGGRGHYQFFSVAMETTVQRRLAIENGLHRALREGELALHFEPQIDLASGRMVGLEALMRWHPPGGDSISPVEFIPVAEETGLIVPMGGWAIREACRLGRTWLDQGLTGFTVAVNLSGRQLAEADLPARIGWILLETGFPPEMLELEITESMLMERMDRAVGLLAEIRRQGVTIAIDDFGTGYSSIGHLKHLPIDRLKIDRCFIRDLTNDAEDKAIISAIIALGHNLGLNVLAEGAELPEHATELSRMGCDVVQGYLYSQAVPAEAVPQLFSRFAPSSQSA